MQLRKAAAEGGCGGRAGLGLVQPGGQLALSIWAPPSLTHVQPEAHVDLVARQAAAQVLPAGREEGNMRWQAGNPGHTLPLTSSMYPPHRHPLALLLLSPRPALPSQHPRHQPSLPTCCRTP